MSYQAHKIAERLFQGGYPPGGPGLANAHIDVLVLCAREHQDTSLYPGVHVILAGGDDDARPERLRRFLEMWEGAAREVVKAVREGKNVLVTCMAGHNRSGLVVALALRELTGATGKEIVEHIQRTRGPFALNNETFAKHIENKFRDRVAV